MPQRDSDDFTYSDGDLETVSGGKWAKLTGFVPLAVVSGGVKGQPTAEDSTCVISTWVGDTVNQYGQFVVTVAADGGGPTLRSDNTNQFYLLYTNATAVTWKVFKCVGGTFTEINSVAQATTAADTVYFEAQGTTLISKKNGGSPVNNFTDSAIASGKPGGFIWENAVKLDTWTAGDFTVATPTIQPRYADFPKFLLRRR